MCRAKDDGGRRCASSDPEYRRVNRAAQKARRRRKGGEPVCPDCSGTGVRRWQDEHAVWRSALCETCDGAGVLVDRPAAGVAA